MGEKAQLKETGGGGGNAPVKSKGKYLMAYKRRCRRLRLRERDRRYPPPAIWKQNRGGTHPNTNRGEREAPHCGTLKGIPSPFHAKSDKCL
jgi:hypothetical protein